MLIYEKLCECCENMNAKIIQNNKIIYPDTSFAVVGTLFEAHKELGRFCQEQQYCDKLEELFRRDGIKYQREMILPQSFEGEKIGRNKIDFLIEGKIILEVKAKQYIGREDYYQLQRYLNAFSRKLGILVNMRRYAIGPKRVINFNLPVSSEDYFA